MKSLVYGFRDSFVGYSTFFVAPNEAVAKRTFYSLCKSCSTPEFYSLYELAEFDQESGCFNNLAAPFLISSGVDILTDPLFYHPDDKE